MCGPPRLATRSPPLGGNPCQGETSVEVVSKIVAFAAGSAEGDLLILQDAWAKRNGKSLTASEGVRMEWRRRWLVRVPNLPTLDLLQGIACMSPPKRLTARAALDHSVFWPLALVKHEGETIFRGGSGQLRRAERPLFAEGAVVASWRSILR